MKLSNSVILINNNFENKLMLYDRLKHIEYNINPPMFELISEIHHNNYDYNHSIQLYDKNIINQLINYEILVNESEPYINNIKVVKNLDTARIFLEITDKCNLKCKHCYGDYKKSNDNSLSLDQIYEIITKAKEVGIYEFDITGGEPLMYPHLKEVLQALYQAGMIVSIFTNLTLFDKRILDVMHQFGVKKIITSLDSSIPSVHDNFRGYNGAFRKTMDSVQLIRETDIEVSINMTIGNHNKDHIPEIVSFIRETNLPFVLDVVTPEGRGNDLMEDPIAASKILKNIYDSYPEIFGYKKRIIDCGVGKRFIYIKSDGNIYICPSLIFNQFKLGNIDNFNLNHIWAKMNEISKNIFCKERSEDCKSCNGGCRARAYNQYGNINAKDKVYCNLIRGH